MSACANTATSSCAASSKPASHSLASAPTQPAQPQQQPAAEEPPILTHLQLLDPILQFLTRATGQSLISLATLRRTLPKDGPAGDKVGNALQSIPELGRRGILRVAVRRCPAGADDAPSSQPKGEDGDEALQNNCIFDEDEVYRRYNAALNISGNDQPKNTNEQDQDQLLVGFFPKPGHFNGEFIAAAAAAAAAGSKGSAKSSADGKGLHGATKTGAKKRMAALRKSLKAEEKQKKKEKQVDKKAQAKAKSTAKKKQQRKEMGTNVIGDSNTEPVKPSADESKDDVTEDQVVANAPTNRHNDSPEAKEALDCYRKLMGIKDAKNGDGNKSKEEDGPEPLMLPGQTVYAGCKPAREVRYGNLSEETRRFIPSALVEAMGLNIDLEDAPTQAQSQTRRRLYYHQAAAVESILNGHNTTICTGTGSGKSLCFLLPVLAMVMKTDIDAVTAAAFSSSNDEVVGGAAAIIMFPTKALAQDQYTKLMGLINSHPLLVDHIRVGVIDGDTPHSSRADIVKHSNIILTNPDTIHAAILPNWKRTYAPFLAKVQYVVIDESHMYEGAFGAHVSLVLARLVRVCAAAFYKQCDDPTEEQKPITFVGCSATIGRPKEHFRLLCPIAKDGVVKVLSPEDDGSPCESKFFFTHTPPLLDTSGKSTGKLVIPVTKKTKGFGDDGTTQDQGRKCRGSSNRGAALRRAPMHRRHAADETARLLAAAVRNGIRCIAFCKTRSLCEWVYERCISDLRSTATSGSDLSKKVESYRGGYSADARRSIEKRLFKEELLAVVATSALELGVDIGGIDLILHCGYPGSISSLMQQAGRAGRGGKPSASIMVCFSSPSEQHFWRFPKTLLSNGLDAPPAVPVNAGLLQNHLLCAGEEYSLVGENSITTLLTSERREPVRSQIVDRDLFSGALYDECIEKLLQDRLMTAGKVTVADAGGKDEIISTFSTHPSVDRPYSRVSLRSIEPIAYQIVDLNHNLQGGRTDTINENAVLDTIPYSRVFYHAFPGAVIMHRGHRYKVEVMNNPPPFTDCSSIGYCRSLKLGAFAKQTNVTYMTQALALTHITVVKQFDRVEILPKDVRKSGKSKGGTDNTDDLYKNPELNTGAIAGNGVVTVKRTVHGYKRLSPVNRVEISRHELKMPSMEYDTNAIWFDCEASLLASVMPGFDEGVHALSHALLAVAPLFVPCTSADIDCDHSRHDTTRIMMFDNRAGGAGISSRLWRHFFRPDGILSSAIELLEHCSTCSDESGFKGGCPGCIQSVPCINFHEDLSRPAGLRIARRLLKRIEQTALYKENAKALDLHVVNEKEENTNDAETNGTNASVSSEATPDRPTNEVTEDTPRRLARKRALEFAKDLESAKKRSVVVGRPSWPADERN